MTAINEIPGAFALQAQLVSVETAIESLKAGGLVSGVSVTNAMPDQPGIGMPLSQNTQVVCDPPIDDQVAIDNIVAMLGGQKEKLIKQLQSLGFTYTGTAIPPKKPAPPLPNHMGLMQREPSQALPPPPLIAAPPLAPPLDTLAEPPMPTETPKTPPSLQ